VGLGLFRRALLLDQLDRLLQARQALLAHLLDRVVALDLRLRRRELVEQRALAVLLPRLRVRLRERERLAERAAALRGRGHRARERRALDDELPLVRLEVGLPGQCLLLSLAAIPLQYRAVTLTG